MVSIVTKGAESLSDLPLKLDLDLQKPVAFKGGEAGMLVIPDKGLSGEKIAQAGKEIAPVGQLWMYRVAAAKDGKVVPNSKLRLVTVSDGKKSASVQLYLLGVRKGEKGPELVVFGGNKDPLMTLPLEKAEEGQAVPINLSGRKTGDDSGQLTLNLLGKYKVDISVMKQEE